MNDIELKRMVVVVTLTAKVHEGKTVTVSRCRIGFCGTFDNRNLMLSEIKKKFKKAYVEQLKSAFRQANKITCSSTVKTMECDILPEGGI